MLASSAFAAEQCDVTFYTTADGLSSNLISCAAQDSAGLLWFGTWKGLSCFDGYRFLNFPSEGASGAALPTNRIQLMKTGAHNKLWCVTYDKRLYAFNTSSCEFTDYSGRIEQALGFSPIVRNIFPIPSADVYIAVDDKSHPFIKIDHAGNITDLTLKYAPSGETIFEVETDADGATPIVYTSSDTPGQALKYIGEAAPVAMPMDQLRLRKRHFTDPKGRHWVVAPEGISVDGRKLTSIPAGASSMSVNATMDYPVFFTDSRSTVWMAADGGNLSYYDEDYDLILPAEYRISTPTDHHLTEITKWFVDKQCNIWSFGPHFLCRISPSSGKVEYCETAPGKDVRSLIFTDGNIEHEGKSSSAHLYSCLIDSKGRRWEGYKREGLFLTTPDGSTMHFSAKDSTLQGNDVFDIFEDSRGNIWVACYDGGLNLLDEHSATPEFLNTSNCFNNYPELKHIKVRRIAEAPGGVMILSTAQGIVAFSNRFDNPSQIKFTHYEAESANSDALRGGNVMQTLVSRRKGNHIYISTMGGGLFTLSSGNLLDGTAKFAPVEGTFNSPGIIQAMVEDKAGNLWLARENTLQQFNPLKSESLSFGRNDLGRDVAFSEALPAIDLATGRIAMGAYGGYILFNPAEMSKSDYIPPVIFSHVQYHGDDNRYPILHNDRLDVPADRRNLSISFAALDYRDNSRIRYAFRLDGSQWQNIDESHSVSFNPLPPGHHTLEVRSTNADGTWVDNVASLKIYSHPTFWETPWAWLLYAAAAAALFYALYYFRRMKIERKRERAAMEQRVNSLLAQLNEAKSSAADSFIAPPIYSAQTEVVEMRDSDKLLMEKLMAYIEAHIADTDFKISEAAAHVALGRTTFTERIKEITGMPPADFLRHLRMQRACRLIATTDLTLSQIAYAVGFADPNYFSKAFKRAFGVSPTSYRESARPASAQR